MQLGTDPEFFIIRRATGKPVPAHKFFPDKHHKLLAEFDVRGGNYYGDQALIIARNKAYYPDEASILDSFAPAKLFRDGFALEVNVNADSCRAQLSHKVRRALKLAQDHIGPAYELVAAPTAQIDFDDLVDAPDDVLEFGCDPSLDAYTGRAKYSTISAMSHQFRYAGGHMHFSSHPKDNPTDRVLLNKENYPLLAKMLDLYVGIPLSILFNKQSLYQRRAFYGGAGEYREQVYGTSGWRGLEYRSPGPELWMHHAVAGMAFGVGRKVIREFEARSKTWDAGKESAIQNAMNTGEGLKQLVQPVQGFYDLDTLLGLRARIKAERWNIEKQNIGFKDNSVIAERGWTEFASKEWKLKIAS